MNSKIFVIEKQILRIGQEVGLGEIIDTNWDTEFVTIITSTIQGRYEDVLNHPFTSQILGTDSWNPTDQEESVKYDRIEALILSNVHKAVDSGEEDSSLLRELCTLCIAVSCLQLFVQHNWVGPPPSEQPQWTKSIQGIGSQLSIDGDTIYPHTHTPVYLWLARIILLEARDVLQHCQTSPWWLLRCLQTHQALLDDRSPTLKATISQLIDTVSKNEQLMADDNLRDLSLQFHLEAGHLMYFYYEPKQAEEHFNTAHKLSGLNIELTGALGKRTRFQKKEISQLVLQVQREAASKEEQPQAVLDTAHIPKNIPMDDDTVLEQIAFTDSDEQFSVRLRPEEQALCLGLCHHHRKSHEGQGKIVEEECMAYVNCALSQPTTWAVQTTALLLRTHWENDSARRLQRSMMQLEELVNQYKRPEPEGRQRLPLVYTCKLCPHWQVERELGQLLVKVGAMNAALEVFLRLQAWEDIIKCYTALGRRERAEEIIREQLAIQETPDLWCYLGDVTHNAEDYQRAWELSNSRSARSQRALGYLYLNKGQFATSLPYFEKALEVNALQVHVWFSYGCACLGCEEYEKAAKAFHRCVTLTQDNFEAWNNLSTAYIKSHQKARAFVTLGEALRCEFENWRIWENYLLVGTDVGEFREVIRAYHRLMDLRDKHSDVQVLKVLVRAVKEDIPDAKDEPSSKLRGELLQLFGRITSKITSNGDIWQMYGELLMNGDDASETDQQRAVQFLQKAHRCNTQAFGWEKDQSKCEEVAKQALSLVKAYLSCSEKVSDNTQRIQMLSSARLSTKGVLTKIKQHQVDPMSKELVENLKEPYRLLEEELEKVNSAISELKSV